MIWLQKRFIIDPRKISRNFQSTNSMDRVQKFADSGPSVISNTDCLPIAYYWSVIRIIPQACSMRGAMYGIVASYEQLSGCASDLTLT